MATSPTAAMRAALAAYLTTYLVQHGLPDAECMERWPDANQPLKLSPTRVVLSVVLVGAPRTTRIGGPVVNRVMPGAMPAATIRWDWDQQDQDLMLGLWAETGALRDDADELLHAALNRPYWDTCPPVVNTTLRQVAPVSGPGVASYVVPAPGRYMVTPASMADIWQGTLLQVDTGDRREVVRVEAITPFGFVATFANAHNLSLIHI